LEFVDAGLVAPVATMMLPGADIAFDRFGYGGLSHHQVRDLHVANEFSHADSIADVSVCECCRLKFGAFKITPALDRWLAARCRMVRAVCLRAMQQFDHGLLRPGSMSCEMLRLGYITEKSQPIPPFRSRIGQTACS